MGLLITLIVGLFTLLGSFIVIKTNNSKKIVNLSVSVGFGVLVSLVLFELIPECVEIFTNEYGVVLGSLIIIIAIFVGILILKILDRFIPDHDIHNKNNLTHVGLITSIALFIHNFLEGMVIYTSFNGELKFGILLGLGVAMHNVPLGMSITSFSYENGKYNALLLSLVVSLSTFVGGLFGFIFKGVFINELLSGVILSITIGMLVYIIMFELLGHIIENKSKISTCLGIIVGVLILVISILL